MKQANELTRLKLHVQNTIAEQLTKAEEVGAKERGEAYAIKTANECCLQIADKEERVKSQSEVVESAETTPIEVV